MRPNAKHWVVVHVEVQARVNELIHEDRLIWRDVCKAVITGHDDVDFVDEVGFGKLVEEVAYIAVTGSQDPESLFSIRTLSEWKRELSTCARQNNVNAFARQEN